MECAAVGTVDVQKQSTMAFDVVVIGAGVSGLHAASTLANTYGLKVKVLEARSKVGGVSTRVRRRRKTRHRQPSRLSSFGLL